ncbi:isochorismatase family protein [Streptomyces sp. 3MP-14]|uniref:Isochorismatase family protein n=1 Tax=Streptomyces mimosae TaxID=2586635 RepID=A0A5N6AE67_9ACTN|nr:MULTISPECIES: isochorismatase family cysteine hydrolase [Streptomyces]KAB8165808.1 isochorismatase family protein [Streptomyces mimosae]KAB8176197.1 isochorismatase family protein [Streptomyces sp. 3MP-14]
MTRGTALALIDLQNDFCAGTVAAQRVTDDPTPLSAVAENAARAVALARAAGTEVLFVRFLGDPAHQGPSWRRRDLAQGRPASCVAGSWGAEFTGVAPGAGERVFTKRACFDAFLAEGFEAHLRARGVRRLVMAGLFADVCVDSTARTAFQKGFDITVLSDCTTSLHLPYPEVLRFMARFYGARIVEHRDPSWRAAAEEG